MRETHFTAMSDGGRRPHVPLLRFDVDDVEIEFFYDPDFDESAR